MNIDIFPTLVNLAGGSPPADRAIDGENIMPLLTADAETPHEVLYLFNNDRIAGVRSGKWKLVLESFYRITVRSLDVPESDYGSEGLLFDLERDPTETYSYTRENPDVVKRMRELLVKGQQELDASVLPQMWNRF